MSPLGFSIQQGDPNIQSISFDESFASTLETLVKEKPGTFSIFVKKLTSGQTYSYNTEDQYYAASLFKVPLAISVLQDAQAGNISLDDELVYQERHFSEGSGALQNEPFGSTYTVAQLFTQLLKASDNIAQSMLLEVVDQNKVYAIMPNFENVRIAQITQVFENLYKGEYLNEENTTALFTTMVGTSFDDRIHSGLPEGVQFSHKIGNWPELNSWHDCGIIINTEEPILLCVMSKNTTFEDFVEVAGSLGKSVFSTN